MEYLYKIVIVKDKDGKNQIVKADFIFKWKNNLPISKKPYLII
jgi:hypothetical protein